MPPSEDQRPIIVRSFPASDREFADAAGVALEGAQADSDDLATLRAVVERRLCETYPNARVHAQDELAGLAIQDVVWYAYRDGRIRSADPSRERLYTAFAAARRTVQESEAALRHAQDVTRLAGFDDPDPPLPEAPIINGRGSLPGVPTPRPARSQPR
jgi:hypothetical protein